MSPAPRPVVVVDDHLLLRLLLDTEPADLRPPHARIFTTGLWYHRACRATGSADVVGSLSRLLGGTDRGVAAAAVRAVIALPESIEVNDPDADCPGTPIATLAVGADETVECTHVAVTGDTGTYSNVASATSTEVTPTFHKVVVGSPVEAGASRLGGGRPILNITRTVCVGRFSGS